MPLKTYSVLKGRPINNRLATGRSPHYQVLVSANGEMHRIAINVQSQDGSEVQFLVRSRFEHPITAALATLPEGVTAFTAIVTVPVAGETRSAQFEVGLDGDTDHAH